MDNFRIGDIHYLFAVWIVSAVLLTIGAILGRKSVRVYGAQPWAIFLIFGSVGGLAAMPVLSLTGLDDYAIPLTAVAFFISIPVMHWLMPALAGDFHTENFGASMMLAFLVAISTGLCAHALGQTNYLINVEALSAPPPMPEEEQDY